MGALEDGVGQRQGGGRRGLGIVGRREPPAFDGQRAETAGRIDPSHIIGRHRRIGDQLDFGVVHAKSGERDGGGQIGVLGIVAGRLAGRAAPNAQGDNLDNPDVVFLGEGQDIAYFKRSMGFSHQLTVTS